MEYKALYRCRLCGGLFTDGTTGEAIAEATLQELHAGICGTVPMAPRMTETHRCTGGSLGVADFLGWKAKKSASLVYDEKTESGLLED